MSVQVIWDVNETETQTDCLTEYTTSSETKISLNRVCVFVSHLYIYL